jgi:GGDEF domain-containing protein
LPQPQLDWPPGERLGGFRVRRNGHTPAGTPEVTLHQPSIAIATPPEELRRLLGANIEENRQLTAHVRRLEAEVSRNSAELVKLRGDLHGAVHDALTDPLTGLANRRSFDLKLGAIAAHASSSLPAHLVMADIDHFKRINDAHGHDIGDEVLRIVGEVLLTDVRRDSLVGRLGGDEFDPAAGGQPGRCGTDRPPPERALRVPSARRAQSFPRSSSESRCRSAWPAGVRTKAVPNGMHAPMRRCTRRSAAAAIASASPRCSSPSFSLEGRCKFKFFLPYIMLTDRIRANRQKSLVCFAHVGEHR